MPKFKQQEHENVGKFILYDNGIKAGEIHYKRKDNETIIATHTEVEEQFQGQGFGMSLIDRLAEFARNNSLKIVPQCEYVKKVFQKNTNFADVKK